MFSLCARIPYSNAARAHTHTQFNVTQNISEDFLYGCFWFWNEIFDQETACLKYVLYNKFMKWLMSYVMLYKYNTTCGIFPKPHTPKKKILKKTGCILRMLHCVHIHYDLLYRSILYTRIIESWIFYLLSHLTINCVYIWRIKYVRYGLNKTIEYVIYS